MLEKQTFVVVTAEDIVQADRLVGGKVTEADPYQVAVARHLGAPFYSVEVTLPKRLMGYHHRPGWIKVHNFAGHRLLRADLMHTHGHALELHRSGESAKRMRSRPLTLAFMSV